MSVFVHIPKTAGTSIANSLRVRNTHAPHWKREEDGFRFTFIRNPWDRARSWFYHRRLNRRGNFEPWVRAGCPDEWSVGKTGVRITYQEDWFETDGVAAVDFIGRFENLAADYRSVCLAMGRSEEQIPELTHDNDRGGSKRRPWREDWNEAMRNAVPWLDAFAGRYGYEFGS